MEEKEGFTFVGWDKEFNCITENTVVTAIYKAKTFDVVFKDQDGTELKTESVEYGKSATAPEMEEKEGFTFIGWDKEFSKITENTVVTAIYEIKTDVIVPPETDDGDKEQDTETDKEENTEQDKNDPSDKNDQNNQNDKNDKNNESQVTINPETGDTENISIIVIIGIISLSGLIVLRRIIKRTQEI